MNKDFEMPLLSSNWSSKGILREKKVLQEILLGVDWQRHSIRFHEDIRSISIRCEFFFLRCLIIWISGSEPSKYPGT